MKKGLMKRAAAALCAAVLAASMLAGCSQTDYSMTVSGEKINAGVYINFLLTEMTNQMYTLYYAQKISDPSEALTQNIDGKSFKTYVKEEAIKKTKEFAAINAKFDELGLKLTKDQKAEIKDQVESSWEQSKDFYEVEGISKESLKIVTEMTYKRQAVFDHYYETDGETPVTDEDIQNYLNENYIRFKQIAFSKSFAAEGEDVEAENAEIKAKAESYLEQAKSVDFEGFDELIKQYKEEQEAEKAAEEEAGAEGEETAEAPADTTESAAEETAESAAEEETEESASDESLAEVEDTVSQAEAEAEAEKEKEEVKAPEEEASAETSADEEAPAETEAADEEAETAETSEETEDSAEVEDLSSDTDVSLDDITGAEAEEDNEIIADYTYSQDKTSDTYDEAYANRLTAVKNAKMGEATFYEDDTAYYVFMSADIADKPEYAKENHAVLISDMKEDEFQGLIDSWVEAMDIKMNSKAVKRYSVQEVYDRQEEYYSKQGQQ